MCGRSWMIGKPWKEETYQIDQIDKAIQIGDYTHNHLREIIKIQVDDYEYSFLSMYGSGERSFVKR